MSKSEENSSLLIAKFSIKQVLEALEYGKEKTKEDVNHHRINTIQETIYDNQIKRAKEKLGIASIEIVL